MLALIAGCTAQPLPGPSSPSASGSAAPTESAGPVLHPDGTADDNLPLFTAVTGQVWATGASDGRAYIDALVAAGFDKASMQVTDSTSTVGNPAESVQFSVLWGEECLIGQVGPATGDPVTTVMPALAGGACLIGSTRPIDW